MRIAMSLSAVETALLPLVGVVLGTGGLLVGQYFTHRSTRQKDIADRRAALRAERKDAIVEFLLAARRAERTAALFKESGRRPADSEAISDEMWHMQKCLTLVAAQQLRDASQSYAGRLNQALWHGVPEDASVWEYIDKQRHQFMQEARAELGIEDL
jgi:hypothetical protein